MEFGPSVRGRKFDRVPVAPRQNREEFVPARFAAERRQMASAPDRRKCRSHVLRRDASQVSIPANRAMRVQSIAQPHHAGVEARPASRAPPGVYTKNAQDIVRGALPARTPRAEMFTDGADPSVRPGFALVLHVFAQHRSMHGLRQETESNRQPGTIVLLEERP
jgi:hypothetical protein